MVRIALICFIAVVVFFISTLAWIWWKVKTDVDKIPKQPFSECERHGLYPTKYSIWIEIPAEGRPLLKQEMCPQCYADRFTASEAKIKEIIQKTNPKVDDGKDNGEGTIHPG